jgi:hypothetical protein
MPLPRTIGLAVGAVAVAGVSAFGGGLASAAPAPAANPGTAARTAPHTSVSTLSSITRAQVLARAQTWHPHTSQRVPYSQSRTHGGYRTDCSGYASMALALGKPGPSTRDLRKPRYSTRISMSQLKPGDLVIDWQGRHTHVVIFAKWANSRHSLYWEYEQRGRTKTSGYGTDYRTRNYGLARGSQFHAYRPNNIR